MRLSTLTIAIAALMAPIASVNAMPPVRAGILQCQGGQNVGFVVGSVTSLQCVFQSEGRRPEPYLATVRRLGVDLGFTEQTQLAHLRDDRLGKLVDRVIVLGLRDDLLIDELADHLDDRPLLVKRRGRCRHRVLSVQSAD